MATCMCTALLMIDHEGAAHAAGLGCCAGAPRAALWADMRGGADACCAQKLGLPGPMGCTLRHDFMKRGHACSIQSTQACQKKLRDAGFLPGCRMFWDNWVAWDGLG